MSSLQKLTDISKLLARVIGLEESSLGITLIRKAIDRRMQSLKLTDIAAYSELLDSNSLEVQKLVEEIVVGESWFFRHSASFDLLTKHAQAHLSANRGPYRVLSFPCAGGEEPYSIAITLLEAGFSSTNFTVEAGDVSEKAIDRAMTAVYSERSIRMVKKDTLSRYFEITPKGFHVRPIITSRIQFSIANILQPTNLPFDGPYHAIFCRNLLIYLTTEARTEVIKRLEERLDHSGLLFVGHAELLNELLSKFEIIPERGAFAYKLRNSSRPIPSIPTKKVLPSRTVSLERPEATTVPKKQAKPAVAPVPLVSVSPTVDLLREAQDMAGRKEYIKAEQICRKALSAQGHTPRAYHLLGMILQAMGRDLESEQALQRAVYLESDHEDSLLALSLLALKRGERESAERYAQRAARAHQRSERQ